MHNLIRTVHPALSPAIVAPKFPIIRSGDSLEEHIVNLYDYIAKETLHSRQYSKRDGLYMVLETFPPSICPQMKSRVFLEMHSQPPDGRRGIPWKLLSFLAVTIKMSGARNMNLNFPHPKFMLFPTQHTQSPLFTLTLRPTPMLSQTNLQLPVSTVATNTMVFVVLFPSN